MHPRAVLIALTLLVATACGGTPSPEPAPYSPTSSTSSSTASPDGSDDSLEASAQRFVVRYFAVFASASNTGDTAKLRTFGAQGCNSCDQVVQAIEKTYRGGGHARGVAFKLRNISVTASDERAVVAASILLGQQTYASSSAAPEETLAPAKDHVTVNLHRAGSTWVITEWTRE